MSLERAYKACNLCQGYDNVVKANSAEVNRDGGRDPMAHERIFRYSSLRDNATFEAMRALEKVKDDTKKKNGDIAIILNILQSCKNCDYSAPKIAESLDEKI